MNAPALATRKALTVGMFKEATKDYPDNTPIYVGECELCFGYCIGFKEPVLCKRCGERVVATPIIVGV